MNFFFSSRRRHTFFFQAEDGIRDRSPSRGLGDVYKRQDTEEELEYLKHLLKAKYKSILYNREWNNLLKCFKQHKLSFL